MPEGWTTIKHRTNEQAARFLAAVESLRDRALFATIYHYGLRVSEATLLRLEDVTWLGGGFVSTDSTMAWAARGLCSRTLQSSSANTCRSAWL